MGEHTVSFDTLKNYCAKLMMTQGVPEDEAQIIGQHLVTAEAYGLGSHGVSRTSIYLKRLNTGVVNAKKAAAALSPPITPTTSAWRVSIQIWLQRPA